MNQEVKLETKKKLSVSKISKKGSEVTESAKLYYLEGNKKGVLLHENEPIRKFLDIMTKILVLSTVLTCDTNGVDNFFSHITNKVKEELDLEDIDVKFKLLEYENNENTLDFCCVKVKEEEDIERILKRLNGCCIRSMCLSVAFVGENDCRA